MSGFSLEFSSLPSRSKIPLNAQITNQWDLCNKEVVDLLDKGAIVESSKWYGFVSGIFLIIKKNGGFRPIIHAYLTVHMAKPSRKFLRSNLDNHSFEFMSLPFGLSVAQWVFTKLLRRVIASLRCKSILAVIYLDDILIWAFSKDESARATFLVQLLLESQGFVISEDKSCFQSSQIL